MKRLLGVAAQLGLVLLVFVVYRVEHDSGFGWLAPLIFGGFLVHAVLPLRYRLPFFLLLSLSAFGLLMGTSALVLVGLGLGLIGICHLPIRLGTRAALLLAAGAGLAAVHAGWTPLGKADWTALVLPILGSIFMFRLVVYLYDVQHEKMPSSLWERLSYFFLLPNACFLLFPVIDYQTFRRTYYDDDAYAIYQKGVLWMFRGVVHLLLYRLLYYHVVPAPGEVQGLGGVVLFVAGTYLLYLRVSGLFHLIIGVLCLFGFNLPETHHLYLLASSFNDFWRRINIYWKDFMMKVVYYPVFMRLRKGGVERALVLSTAVVFLATWLLHSYQWFWLLGAFPLTVTDGLFWTVFGAVVIANSVWQLRRGKRATLGEPAFSFRGALNHALRVVGMFVFIALLWSFWYSPSPADWLSTLSQAGTSGPGAYALLGLGLAALVAIGVAVQYGKSRGWRLTLAGASPAPQRSAALTGLGALLILGLGFAPVQRQLGEDAAGFLVSLQVSRLNAYEGAREERGYYEDLLVTNSITAQAGGVRGRRPINWVNIRETGAVRPTSDLLGYEMVPSRTTIVKDAPLVANRWGMHDRDYAQHKPPGTYRIALLGASYVMGVGVLAGETFEAVAEERLNREWAGRGPYDRYEILNFAVGGYTPLQQLALLDRALAFEPDVLLSSAHSGDSDRTLASLAGFIGEGRPLPPYLEAIRQKAGAEPAMPTTEILRRLEPYKREVMLEGYRTYAALSRAAGALPVWVLVPRTDNDLERGDAAELARSAQEAGFLVLNLRGAYGNAPLPAIQLAPWDDHPNPLGHRLLAERLYAVLLEHRDALHLTGHADTAALSATPASTTLHP